MGAEMMGELGLETSRPLLNRLLVLLQEQMGDGLLALCLYGSAARGQAEPTSDRDVLVIHWAGSGERNCWRQK